MELDAQLREDVKLLGEILGERIQLDLGPQTFKCIEEIRTAAKTSRQEQDPKRLYELLADLSDEQVLPVTRAFNQFLNLANLAEQFHGIKSEDLNIDALEQNFKALADKIKDPQGLMSNLLDTHIDLVLTAHPTEVTRRTLIQKYDALSAQLRLLDQYRQQPLKKEKVEEDIRALVAAIWHTDEIRRKKPTAIDEAKWGFAVIENSLWQALPDFLRRLDQVAKKYCDQSLPLDFTPVRFSSWMGGDRDGNPNVTHQTTNEVLLLGRWMAADLYLRDIDQLNSKLSMNECNEALQQEVGQVAEPYRKLLHGIKKRLQHTQQWCQSQLANEVSDLQPINNIDELKQPLLIIHQSLLDTQLEVLANGAVLDLIRRIHCFGLNLSRLDIRQESERHAEVLSELCEYLNLGDYSGWSEIQKQQFLITELQNKRPLIPPRWQPSSTVQEVLDTCKVLASQAQGLVGPYIISMAHVPSDVLAVALLLSESGMDELPPIVPLFETLDDLNNSADTLEKLLQVPWYKQQIQGYQQVMIGYSDSAKDAGQLAAAWGQYEGQEALVGVAKKHAVSLCLFHGRGGTVGRGGGPAHSAIMAQPPGSVDAGFRVTEQGEMIRFKFGLPEMAQKSMGIYVTATLEARMAPPPVPEDRWRQCITSLAENAVSSYRKMVREEKDFVPYFRSLTPEQELGKLALGSRPAKRKAQGGVESLRAIPWIFAWTQVRLMLPAWLGADEALDQDDKGIKILQDMYQGWPFFQTYIDMLEMVLCKTEPEMAEYYERNLVAPELYPIGAKIRQRLRHAVDLVNKIKQQPSLIYNQPLLQQTMAVRNPYTDPLHYLQAELLRRYRQDENLQSDIDKALVVSMAGIAAGLRNTG